MTDLREKLAALEPRDERERALVAAENADLRAQVERLRAILTQAHARLRGERGPGNADDCPDACEDQCCGWLDLCKDDPRGAARAKEG